MKTTENYIWVIAYIDKSTLHLLERDLSKDEQYASIEAHVPTVKILKKQFKGKDFFDEVPLLFNYGFIKIPYAWAINPDLLDKVKKDLTCISHWIVDPASSPKKKGFNFNSVRVATATDQQVKDMVKIANEESIHSSEDITKLRIGEIIHLMGYPFEGMTATVIEVNLRKKVVKVSVGMNIGDDGDFNLTRDIEVSFDNVFYSIYRGSYDENYNKEKTLADYQLKNQVSHENE